MQAVVVRETGSADVLRMETVARPAPAAREVLIRVAACGVCTLDVVTRNGTYRRNVQLPIIPGHEIAGTVTAAGSEVRRFRVGDRVATTQRYHICGTCRYCRGGYEPLCEERRFLGQQGLVGGYAEYVAVEEDNVAVIPAGVSEEHAAIAACAIGTTLNAVRDVGRVRLGEDVLVTGAGGGLGVHAVQMARLAGAHVIAQTTAPDKAALLSEVGAHEVLVTARDEDFSPRVQALTGGAGADVLIDNVGTPLFTAMRRSLAANGRWVLVGELTGDFVPFNPAQLFLRNQSMLSVNSTTRAQLEDTLALIARGAIRPVISGVESLRNVGAVHARMERGSVAGRIVVRPEGATA
ncbi:MAG TPA: alcohol dehydrogenase catalytic domain-containing protein [Burkholderiales bacterium]|nr:alcohol dehydrogenase catalytic domain-containing protein [Burkholderiales bacterium]